MERAWFLVFFCFLWEAVSVAGVCQRRTDIRKPTTLKQVFRICRFAQPSASTPEDRSIPWSTWSASMAVVSGYPRLYFEGARPQPRRLSCIEMRALRFYLSCSGGLFRSRTTGCMHGIMGKGFAGCAGGAPLVFAVAIQLCRPTYVTRLVAMAPSQPSGE